MKTQTEILEKMHALETSDFFGFEREVLLEALEFEHAKAFLKEGATHEAWDSRTHGTREVITLGTGPLKGDLLRAVALDYLEFAWGKALDHRGISADRSVRKMTAFLWLMGLDSKAIEDAPHAMYGCPGLKVASEQLGVPLPVDPMLILMMNGEPCSPGCEGCQ